MTIEMCSELRNTIESHVALEHYVLYSSSMSVSSLRNSIKDESNRESDLDFVFHASFRIQDAVDLEPTQRLITLRVQARVSAEPRSVAYQSIMFETDPRTRHRCDEATRTGSSDACSTNLYVSEDPPRSASQTFLCKSKKKIESYSEDAPTRPMWDIYFGI